MNAANKHSMTTRAKAYAEAYAKTQQEKKMEEQEYILEYTIDQFNMEKTRTFALASLALMGSAVFIIKNPLWTKVVQIWYLIFAFKILDSLNNYKPNTPDNLLYTWFIQTFYGKQVKIILDESDDEEEQEEEEEEEEEEEDDDDPTDEDYVDKPIIRRTSTKKKATHNNNIAKEMDNDIHIVSTSEMAKADEPNTGSLDTDNSSNNTSMPNTDNSSNNTSMPNTDNSSNNASTEPNAELQSKEPTTDDCASPDTNLSLKIPDAEDYIMAERLSN
jgi:hypothetical protein